MIRTVRAAPGRVANDRPRRGRRISHEWMTIVSNEWIEHLISIGDVEVRSEKPDEKPVTVAPQVMPVAVDLDDTGETMVDVPASAEPDVSPESALTQATATEPRPAARKHKRSPRNGA